MPQTVIRAPESTENIPSARRVRDVDKRIHYLDPDAAPFTLILARSRSRSAVNSKFEWIEKDLPAKWAPVNGAQTATDTAIEVDAGYGAYFSVGDVVENVRTFEKFRVTVVATDTLTVVRAVDGDGINGTAMNDNDDLMIIGNAFAEGSSAPAEKSHIETFPFNYTQILKLAFGTTGTQEVSENYTGPDRPRLRREKAIEHRIQMERTALFGERNLFTSGDTDATLNTPRRYTGGFFYFFGTASNIKDAGGILTEAEMESWLGDVFAHTGSGNTRVLFASTLIISVLDQIAVARMQTVPRASTYGLGVTQWVTAHGELMVVKHRLLENGVNATGYGGFALAVDVGNLSYVYLNGRNTKMEIDIQANDADLWKDQYKTECGWQMENPLIHGVLKNVTG